MIINPLKVWVQNVLPVVYDDSLSYLEVIAAINAKTNEIITQTNANTNGIETLAEAIAELGDIEELRALLDEIEAIIDNLYTTDAPLMDGTASAGSANHAARSDHVHPSDKSRAPVNHASNATTYGVGNANNYGHVKITDDINSTAGGTAIKPSVVKTVNDKLSTFTKNNLLDNWYFVGTGSQDGDGIFPINQRGQATYSTGNAIDRWSMTGSTLNLELQNEFIRINKSAASGNPAFLQILPDNLDGRDVTISILYKTGAPTDTIRLLGADTTIALPASSDFNIFSVTTKLLKRSFSDFSNKVMFGLQFMSNLATNVNTDIKAIKVELGTEQTLAHQEGGVWVLNEIPNWADELVKCQRYYFPIPSAFRINATYRSSTSIDFSFTIPVRMIGTVRFVAPSAKLFASTGTGGAFEEQTGFTYSIPDNTTDNGFVTIRGNKSAHGLIQTTAIVLQPYSKAYLTTYPVET